MQALSDPILCGLHGMPAGHPHWQACSLQVSGTCKPLPHRSASSAPAPGAALKLPENWGLMLSCEAFCLGARGEGLALWDSWSGSRVSGSGI